MQHLLSVDDMKENYIFDLWSKAIDQKNNHSNALKNKILISAQTNRAQLNLQVLFLKFISLNKKSKTSL